jgi:hypothetical protein
LLHFQTLTAASRNAVEVGAVIWPYFLMIAALVLILAWLLIGKVQTRPGRSGGIAAILYVIVIVVAIVLSVATNLNGVRADVYYKQGRSLDNEADTRDQAVEMFRRAISLVPDQPTYHHLLGRTLLMEAERVGPPAENNPFLSQAQQALQQTYAMTPQDVTVNLTLAWLHWKWAELSTDRPAQIAHLTTVNQYYQQAAALRPNQEFIYTEWARAKSQLDGLAGAQAQQEVVHRPGDSSAETSTGLYPVGIVEERPGGNPPRMWIDCLSCAQAGEQVPLLDHPGGEPVVWLPHGTWVYLLDQQPGPDGRDYYLVWGARHQGWVPAYRLSNTPP